MGSLDRQIDPITMDYVDADNGKFAEVDVLENQILCSIAIELESWEGDPALGVAMARLKRSKDRAEDRQALGDAFTASLSWLVTDGSLDRVIATVESYDHGVVVFEVDAYQPGSNMPMNLPTFFIPVGTQGAS